MTHTIVLNNCERNIVAQFKGGEKTAPAMLVLHPGINLVETTSLKKLRDESKLFGDHFVEKLERVRAEEGPGPERVGHTRLEIVVEKDVDPKKPLAKLSPDISAAVVKETFDDSVLKRWLDTEARESVRTAIYKQIAFVTQGKAAE